jgi:myosin heavy subunit
MTKPLLLVAIVLSIASAAVGFLNRGKLLEERANVETAKAETAQKQSALDEANKTIEEQKTQITTLGSEKDTLTANLGEAQAEATKVKEELAAAQEKTTTLETELAQAKTDSEAKDTRIAELEQQATAAPAAPAPPSDVAALEAQIQELQTVNNQLTDQNTGLTAQIAELQRKEQGRQKVQMRQGLSGTILAVNQAWNFVVLSLGDRQGVVPNAEMLVQRGNQYLGKVRVTSVEPSTSIADILVRTVPRGLSVMPGDRVIYQSQRD